MIRRHQARYQFVQQKERGDCKYVTTTEYERGSQAYQTVSERVYKQSEVVGALKTRKAKKQNKKKNELTNIPESPKESRKHLNSNQSKESPNSLIKPTNEAKVAESIPNH